MKKNAALQRTHESGSHRPQQVGLENHESPEHEPSESFDDFLDEGDESFDEDGDYEDGYEDVDQDRQTDHDSTTHHAPPTRASVAGRIAVAIAYLSGAALIAGGLALLVSWSTGGAAQSMRTFFEQTGLAPIDLVMVGLVLAGLAGIWRRLRQHESGLLTATHALERETTLGEQLHEQLGYLIENHPDTSDGRDRGNVTETVQQLMHLMERQQEKIANLSKATKMYGKPLLEITNQMSETSHDLAELGSRLDTMKVIIEQNANRVETTLKTELGKVGGADSDELREALTATRDTVRGLEALQRDLSQRLTDKTDKMVTELASAKSDSVRNLDQFRSELGASLGKVTTRLTEEITALDRRLGETQAAVTGEVEKLAAADNGAGLGDALTQIREQLAELDQHIGETQTAFAKGVERLAASGSDAGGGGSSAAVDSALAGIQRQLTELSSTVASLNVAGGQAGETAAAGAGGKAGGGKSVQSAIEKLKKMRT